MLKFPCHHSTPHERSFLGRDGILSFPFFAMTRLDLHEIQGTVLLGDDIYLLMLMPPVAGQYLKTAFQQIVHRDIFAPFAKRIMIGDSLQSTLTLSFA